jgi:hypothetical protein
MATTMELFLPAHLLSKWNAEIKPQKRIANNSNLASRLLKASVLDLLLSGHLSSRRRRRVVIKIAKKIPQAKSTLG